MGIRVLYDERNALAAIFCSTSDTAFGPVFNDKEGRPADERAEAFLRWLNANPPAAPAGRLLGSRFDVRFLKSGELEREYLRWLAQEDEQFTHEEREAAEELEEMRRADREEYLAEERAEKADRLEARLHPERFL